MRRGGEEATATTSLSKVSAAAAAAAAAAVLMGRSTYVCTPRNDEKMEGEFDEFLLKKREEEDLPAAG